MKKKIRYPQDPTLQELFDFMAQHMLAQFQLKEIAITGRTQ